VGRLRRKLAAVSAWVGAGAAFDERGHGEIWGESKGKWMDTSLGAWFSCVEQKDRQDVSSLTWIVLGERLAVVRESSSSLSLLALLLPPTDRRVHF